MANPGRPYHPYGNEVYKKGHWVRVKIIGKGAFGSVSLWQNEETEQCVCIKECNTLDLSPRQKSQWHKECKIMLRLRHPNVVRGIITPKELDSGIPDIPVLTLEYCIGGDLRKVLNKAENCCGLPELQVRAVTRDVSLAIEYLHTKQVVHRDLKPENIVMQPMQSSQKLQYKLIDLGYAKDVSAGSICKSFVGTEQYLAPELFTSANHPGLQPYNNNVDYWCLGTTVFECIAGFRPFFHGIPAYQWLLHVSKKRPSQICGILNIENEVVFSDTIPTPNHLCRHSQQKFQQWLRMMLMYDAKDRGGGENNNGRPMCFHLLESILTGRILHIYSVWTNRVLSYPVEHGELMLKVMQLLHQETRIPVQDQVIVLANGQQVSEDDLAVKCCGPEDEASVLFMFPGNFGQLVYQRRPQPELVQYLITHARGKQIQFDILKRGCGHCVYYVTELNRDYKRLLMSKQAIQAYLKLRKLDLARERRELSTLLTNLKSKVEFFQHSMQVDLEKLEKQKSSGIYSNKMVKFWNRTQEDVSKYSELESEVQQLVMECDSLETAVQETNKLQHPSSKDPGPDWERRAVDLYDKFRRIPKDEREKVLLSDHADILKTVTDFMAVHQRYVMEVYHHIEEILTCKNRVFLMFPRISNLQAQLRESGVKVMSYQKQRQKDIWGLFSEVLKSVALPGSQDIDMTDRSSLASSNSSIHLPLVIPHSTIPSHVTATAASTLSGAPSNSGSLMMSSTELITKSTEESVYLRHESVSSQMRLQETLSSLQQTLVRPNPATTPDWGFLDINMSSIDES